MPITDFEKVYTKDTDCPSPIDMFNDTAPAAITELPLVDSNKNVIPPVSTSAPSAPPPTESPELERLMEQFTFVTQEYSAGRMSRKIVLKKVKEIKAAMRQLSQDIPQDD
jgi:hypothetical protein